MIITSQKKEILHCGLMQSAIGALGNPRAAVVIHNTRSCSFLVGNAAKRLRARYHIVTGKRLSLRENIFCTGLTEADTVFGAAETLSRCMKDIICLRHPEYILVAVGCIPGMIGDDTEEACRQIEEETGTPVFLLRGHGFMVPEGIDTVISMTRALLSRFTLPLAERKEKSFDRAIVIGTSLPYLAPEEYLDVTEFLSVLGVEKITWPPFDADVNDYKEMADASLVVQLARGVLKTDAARALAHDIAEALCVPCLEIRATASPDEIVRNSIEAGRIRGRTCEMECWAAEKKARLTAHQNQFCSRYQRKTGMLHVGILREPDVLKSAVNFLSETGIELGCIEADSRLTKGERVRLSQLFPDIGVCCGKCDAPYDLRFTTAPIDLSESGSIVLSSRIGFHGYDGLLRKMEAYMEKNHGEGT